MRRLIKSQNMPPLLIGRIGKQTAIEHHAQILDAIERHDPVAASDAMSMHIRAASEDMDLPSLKSRKSK